MSNPAAIVKDRPEIPGDLPRYPKLSLSHHLSRCAGALAFMAWLAGADIAAETPSASVATEHVAVAVYDGAGSAGKGVPRVLALLGAETNLTVVEPLGFFRSEVAKNNTPKGIMVNSPASSPAASERDVCSVSALTRSRARASETFVTRAASGRLPALARRRTEPPPGPLEVGVARANITPTNALWLAGYAGRTHPADGKATDLWLKAWCLKTRPDAAR